MYSLPDRDNIKAGLWRGKSCHTSLVGFGYRKDPLLRPFITKHRMQPVGLCSRAGAGEGVGHETKERGTQRQVTELDRSSCVCPPTVLSQPSFTLALSAPEAHLVSKLPADEQG